MINIYFGLNITLKNVCLGETVILVQTRGAAIQIRMVALEMKIKDRFDILENKYAGVNCLQVREKGSPSFLLLLLLLFSVFFFSDGEIMEDPCLRNQVIFHDLSSQELLCPLI